MSSVQRLRIMAHAEICQALTDCPGDTITDLVARAGVEPAEDAGFHW